MRAMARTKWKVPLTDSPSPISMRKSTPIIGQRRQQGDEHVARRPCGASAAFPTGPRRPGRPNRAIMVKKDRPPIPSREVRRPGSL